MQTIKTQALLDSEAINALSVDKDALTAQVEFKGGEKYTYRNVALRAIQNLLDNPTQSIGSWVNNNLVKSDRATVLNGDITAYTGKRMDIDKTYPIAYLSGEVKLPFTGLSAKGEATYTNFDDARITDALAEVKYKFADNLLIDLGLTAGYRVLNIDLDDYDNNDLKFEFKGPYVGLEAHF